MKLTKTQKHLLTILIMVLIIAFMVISTYYPIVIQCLLAAVVLVCLYAVILFAVELLSK